MGSELKYLTCKGARPRAGRDETYAGTARDAARGARRKYITREIGRAIEAQRAQAGMSLAELAMGSGIDEARLASFERGEIAPYVDELPRIGDALGIDSSVLLKCLEMAPKLPPCESAKPEDGYE